MSNGFNHNSVDKYLYTKVNDSVITLICLYDDDMLIISNNIDGIKETKRFLSSMFKIKDLGQVDTILGIKLKGIVEVLHWANHIMLKMW